MDTWWKFQIYKAILGYVRISCRITTLMAWLLFVGNSVTTAHFSFCFSIHRGMWFRWQRVWLCIPPAQSKDIEEGVRVTKSIQGHAQRCCKGHWNVLNEAFKLPLSLRIQVSSRSLQRPKCCTSSVLLALGHIVPDCSITSVVSCNAWVSISDSITFDWFQKPSKLQPARPGREGWSSSLTLSCHVHPYSPYWQ